MYINLLNILKAARESDIVVSVNDDTGTISTKKLGTSKSLETNDIMDVIEFIRENLED